MTELINAIKKALRPYSNSLKVLLINALLVLSIPAFSQNLTVKGTVTDKQTGEAMIGVNVVIKSTVQGTTTDIKGMFTLNNCPQNAVLAFTYIGYTQSEVEVNGRSVMDVIMTPVTSALDEVVVIGYGTARKKDLTGSVSSVQG